ncbi:RnfABCDGE type electron transport complex subunit D [Varunaivibrio sulfuroxidans]|uniref:Ion-translocating oxidoreductase complex subunit D n=1 Tax=Varunaivibrio sulfuroxidans TaxID=1773489 RepID=A0A4R3J8B2_9PROT|nr:RnfABCDGE type electron transport complex subunit D [Varunaivibrio sulfuroxidans]TCS61727.1 electron transport complex protein RnfD [Varunaivibrio sulfuroxidans]WES32088.1 RnfABCDGE type electron transport complex subunit D [Varunaivibrio sulfuroxidans]
MSTAFLKSGPFLHGKASTSTSMALVLIALIPTTGYGIFLFGRPALLLCAVTMVSALIFEALCVAAMRRPVLPCLMDGSALLTGVLLVLSLPPWAPWWIGVLGSALAIVVAKQIFGGLGQNVFNPAMMARVALLISFPLDMTTFVKPLGLTDPGAPGWLDSLRITFMPQPAFFDAVSSASVLGHIRTETGRGVSVADALSSLPDLNAMFFGHTAGSLGETSAALILLGGLFLLATRVIRWHIPLAMIATIAAFAATFHAIDPKVYSSATVHVLSGATMMGAFFIATDPVTSPSSTRGRIVFAIGCGALTYIIRTWGGFPEGIAFAVLLMNALTPLIDRYLRPRIHGRTRKGAAITVEKRA